MSFVAASLEYVGGAPGLGLWRYRTTDNLASQTIGVVNASYFAGAAVAAGACTTYKTHRLRAGDIILGSCGNTAAVSSVVPASVNSGVVTYVVPQDWDSNGSSVIPVNFSGAAVISGHGMGA